MRAAGGANVDLRQGRRFLVDAELLLRLSGCGRRDGEQSGGQKARCYFHWVPKGVALAISRAAAATLGVSHGRAQQQVPMHRYMSRHPPDDRLLGARLSPGQPLASPNLAVSGQMARRLVKSAQRVAEPLILSSPRRTSPVVFAGTHDNRTFTPALEVAAAAVRRSFEESPRTGFSEPLPRPSGTRHSAHG